VERGSLRLAWVNPQRVDRPEAPAGPDARFHLVAPPAAPTRPVKLDLAIERQVAGVYGLSNEQFALVFSGAGASAMRAGS
jgi:hypothetical protein